MSTRAIRGLWLPLLVLAGCPAEEPPPRPPAAPTVAQRMDALLSSDRGRRWEACRALARAGAPEALPALAAAYKRDEDEDARYALMHAIVTIADEAGARAIPYLKRLLRDDWPLFRVRAAESLGALRDEAKPALPALLRLYEDVDPTVRFAGAQAVVEVDAAAAPPPATLRIVTETVEQFADSPETLAAAAATLGRLGARAREALPLLRELADHASGEVRRAAARAIRAIERG